MLLKVKWAALGLFVAALVFAGGAAGQNAGGREPSEPRRPGPVGPDTITGPLMPGDSTAPAARPAPDGAVLPHQRPTTAECLAGWQAGSRWTLAEFKSYCGQR